MKAANLAKLERIIRPLAIRLLPPRIVTGKYSSGRINFLNKLRDEIPSGSYEPPEGLSKVLWGIRFRTPIMNAAGMFKNGECYELSTGQGAGAYLGGTGTWNARKGNERNGIYLPFVPYPRSHSASNWLGLPNDGDEANSQRAKQLEKIADAPIGWSVMGSPDLEGKEKLRYLVNGMAFYEHAGVDFLEINESCPNTGHGNPQDNDLADRLKYLKEQFLDQRTRRLPVVVKFSNDTELQQIPALMDMLFEMGYDGVNFGNTSTNYAKRREKIDPKERKLFDFFTHTFGGGISGRALNESSLELAGRAAEYTKAGPPAQEFHIIRTGGIESLGDIKESERAGISLNQWFTGYFENFARHGHELYRKLFGF